MIEVVVYGRPGCCLCDEARAAVERVRRERPFALVEVDVSQDPALHARYGERIPVVAVAGREAFEYRVDEAALAAELERAGREAAGGRGDAPGAR